MNSNVAAPRRRHHTYHALVYQPHQYGLHANIATRTLLDLFKDPNSFSAPVAEEAYDELFSDVNIYINDMAFTTQNDPENIFYATALLMVLHDTPLQSHFVVANLYRYYTGAYLAMDDPIERRDTIECDVKYNEDAKKLFGKCVGKRYTINQLRQYAQAMRRVFHGIDSKTLDAMYRRLANWQQHVQYSHGPYRGTINNGR